MMNLIPRTILPRKYLTLSLLLFLLCHATTGQQLTLNTKKIEVLVDKWNLLHNKADASGFDNIYDDQLLFYSEHVSRSKATLLKKLLFVRNPGYQQRIGADIKYTLHTNGVVKCEFRKEVLRDGEWEAEPMYLLVGFKNHGYWVIGESDHRTDQQYGYKPKVGEAFEVEVESAGINPDNQKLLSEVVVNPTVTNTSDSGDSLSYGSLHIYLVIALLSAGVLIIFLDRMGVKKEKELQAQQEEELMMEDDYDIAVVPETKVPNEPYQVIENHLKQNAFRDFLLKMFDPVFFKYRKTDDGSAGPNGYPAQRLEFDLSDQQSAGPAFAVQYLYKEDTGNELSLLPDGQLSAYREQNDVYFVLGIGGPPDTPHEIYLIPVTQLKSNVINKDELRPFRRSGSFYFDPVSRRLI